MSKTVASFVRWLGTVMIRFWGWIGALSTAIFLLDYIATLQPFIDCLMGHEHRWWFFVGGLFALLFSSFLAWRAEEQQLKHFKMPSLKLQFNPAGDNFIRTVPSSTGLLTYVRVLPTTESRVNNCTGRLLRIERWDGENWVRTPYRETYMLEWSNNWTSTVSTIEHGAEQYLNVCYFAHSDNRPRPTTVADNPSQPGLSREIGPLDAGAFWTHYSDSTFKFTIRVIGEPYAGDTICLSVCRGEAPEHPNVAVIPQSE